MKLLAAFLHLLLHLVAEGLGKTWAVFQPARLDPLAFILSPSS